jgi:hypothetical protein
MYGKHSPLGGNNNKHFYLAQSSGFSFRLHQTQDISVAHRAYYISDDGSVGRVHEFHSYLCDSSPGPGSAQHLRHLGQLGRRVPLLNLILDVCHPWILYYETLDHCATHALRNCIKLYGRPLKATRRIAPPRTQTIQLGKVLGSCLIFGQRIPQFIPCLPLCPCDHLQSAGGGYSTRTRRSHLVVAVQSQFLGIG